MTIPTLRVLVVQTTDHPTELTPSLHHTEDQNRLLLQCYRKYHISAMQKSVTRYLAIGGGD
jgi:hypothetical protein